MPTRMSASAVPASRSSTSGSLTENNRCDKNYGSNGLVTITPIIHIILGFSQNLRGLLVFAALEVVVGDACGGFLDRSVEVAEAVSD